MSTLVFTFISVLSLLNHTFAQSLVQEPTSILQNLTVDTDLIRFSHALGGNSLDETDEVQSQCFVNIPGYPQFLPVVRDHCYFLLFTILIIPSAVTPFSWDGSQLPVPAVYRYGTCVITVYAAKPRAKEVFTQLGIARVAALVVQKCVTAPRGFIGGRHFIGNSDGFWIAVGQQ
ncbi:MAG: hypothetical protein L6R41_005439 [Letrouitia leprolyta]|nr:MAG: hypothetical protein L6R41_005439 [Letrouitia leprolyta]